MSGETSAPSRHQQAGLKPLYTWQAAILSENGPEDATTRFLLLVIGSYMSNVGLSCFPSLSLIACGMRSSRSTVIKHLKLAIEAGWILKIPRTASNGRHTSNEYHARIPGAAMVNVVHHPSAPGAPSLVHVADHPSAPGAPSLVHVADHPSAPGAPSGGVFDGAPRAPLELKDSNYPRENATAPASRRRRTTKSTLPEGWGPSQELWRWLRERNIADSDANAMLEAFTAHAKATAREQADWDASFRLWVMRERKTATRGPQPKQLTLAGQRAEVSCCWTAGGAEPRCGEPGEVSYGGGHYLCSRHAGEHSKLNAARNQEKP